MARKNNGKLAQALEEHITKAVGHALHKYTSLDPNKRLELEQQGINISRVITDEIMPAVNQLHVKRLLIIMEEGIGNMVMLTPALRMLKHVNPLLEVTVWGKEPAVQVIKGWDIVDHVITDFDFTHYDLCYYTIWSTKTKQTYKGILEQFCKNHLDSELSPNRHESVQHNLIADFLGAYGDIAEPHCETVADGVEYGSFMRKVRKHVIDPEDATLPFIVFGDTSLRLPDGGWDAKRWPHYHELAELIRRKFPHYRIIMIGDGEDRKEAERMTWPENVTLDLMGKLNIKELASLIKLAKLYVGNDTGPTHIAAAVGTKTYAIFAPTILGKNMPVGKDVTIINKQFPCSPCQYTERFKTCECIKEITAQEVYETIFFPKEKKKKVILAGDFSGGALRNELYIKATLEKDFGMKVIPFEIRALAKKTNPGDATYELVSKSLHHNPDYVIICGGHDVVPDILIQISHFLPKTKVLNWYADQRGEIEQWFVRLCMACHASFWTTGFPIWLSKIFSQTQKPCLFLPITPDSKSFFPINDVEKDIDVLFVGAPHSADRVNVLKHLIDNGINVQIYGNDNWPKEFKGHHHKQGVYGADLNKLLNRAKIIINSNMFNNIPLYYSDRYFYPLAVRTVGVHQRVPNIEDMFVDGEHVVLFDTPEECLEKVRGLLSNSEERVRIAEAGHRLYKEKYTLKMMLERMFEYAG